MPFRMRLRPGTPRHKTTSWPPLIRAPAAPRATRFSQQLPFALGLALTLASNTAMVTSVLAGGANTPQSVVRGVVRAVEQTSYSTELATRVSAIHVREGEAFKVGDRLLEFDCRRHRASVSAADAQVQEMQLTVDKNQLLLRTQAVGKYDLEVSEARLVKAKAEADALRSQLDQCVVRAPFAGRVMELSLQVHETSQPGKPFIGLVAHERLEVDLIVPSHWVRRLPVGTAFDFRVDELKQAVRVTVTRTSPVVDPVSQTIKIIAAFSNADGAVLPGMSGTAVFMPDGG